MLTSTSHSRSGTFAPREDVLSAHIYLFISFLVLLVLVEKNGLTGGFDGRQRSAPGDLSALRVALASCRHLAVGAAARGGDGERWMASILATAGASDKAAEALARLDAAAARVVSEDTLALM
jgi:hypothetical protein